MPSDEAILMKQKVLSRTLSSCLSRLISSALAIAFFSCGQGPTAAQSNELNRFDDEERYVVAGQPILLRRVADEIVVRFISTNAPVDAVTNWSQSSGLNLEAIRELYQGAVLCRVPLTNGHGRSTKILDALRSDSQVHYAFPVYRAVSTGGRMFLNDEVAVRLISTDPYVFREFGLRIYNQSFSLFRLTQPNSFNPLKICNALLAEPGVAWAEPNFSQEFQLFPPWDINPVDMTFQTNLTSVTRDDLAFSLHPTFTRIGRLDGNSVVEWTGVGTLESSDTPNGPWASVINATSPYVAPLSGPARFFRLRLN
jgi:hypothetical protein